VRLNGDSRTVAGISPHIFFWRGVGLRDLCGIELVVGVTRYRCWDEVDAGVQR